MQSALTDYAGIDGKIAGPEQEMKAVSELIKRGIAENAQAAFRQNKYNLKYNELIQRYNTVAANLESLRKVKANRVIKVDVIGEFIFRFQKLDALTEFDEKLWLTVINTVTVHVDGCMTFKFQGGTENDA